MPPSPLQLEEDLEQLKVLENGYKLKVSLVKSVYSFTREQKNSKVSVVCHWDSLQPLNTPAMSNSLAPSLSLYPPFASQVIKVDHEAHGVDTPGDIAKIEAVMRAHHLD